MIDSEVFHNLYCIQNIKRRIRWVGHEIDEKYVQNLVGKPEGKRALRRRRYLWEDNTKIGFQK
jgi:hypothetical protein